VRREVDGLSTTGPNKARRCGIEAVEQLTFSSWEPGHEYTKQVVLLNTRFKMIQVKYKPPTTTLFSTKFPEPVKISAGTSYTIPITFRPITKEPVEDVLEVTTPEGRFSIPIKATRPKASLRFPELVTCGLSAVGIRSTETFTIANDSKVDTTWTLATPAPFVVSPADGFLVAGESITVTVSWTRDAAQVYEGVCILKYNAADAGTIRNEITMVGYGKYPFLFSQSEASAASDLTMGDESVLEFGEIFVERESTRKIVLINPTPVPAKFQVEHRSIDRDAKFSLSKLAGVVPPGGAVPLRIVYAPKSTAEDCTEFIDIRVFKGNSLAIACHGKSLGPEVSLNNSTINFLDAVCGHKVNKAIKLVNKAAMATQFQILADKDGAFGFSALSGMLGPNETKQITVSFEPDAPIHYSREVDILVHHHAPLRLNIHGNAIGLLRDHHIERVEPTPILQRHIVAYNVKEKRGLAQYPPSALREMASSGLIKVDNEGHLAWATNVVNDAQDLRFCKSGEAKLDAAAAAAKPSASKGHRSKRDRPALKNKGDRSSPGSAHIAVETETEESGDFLSLSNAFIDFGCCPAGSKKKVATIPSQQVTFTNPTDGELLLSWMTDTEPFTVYPVEAAVAPGATQVFDIVFKPVYVNQFYTRELECFVSYTEDRHPRPTEDAFFTRPWHLLTTASGHTFPPTDPSPPKLVWDSERILFPAAKAGNKACVTVVVENIGETTTKLDFGSASGAGVRGGMWSCTPRAVLIPPHARQLLSFELTADEAGRFETEAKCILNGMSEQVQILTLVGSAFEPRITLSDEGSVYFPPTQVGTSIAINQTVQNASLVPVKYVWRIPPSYDGIFSVEPAGGVLGPNQRAVHTWMFSPTAAKMYPCRIPVVILDEGERPTTACGMNVAQDSAVMVAEGTVGVLTSTPDTVLVQDSLSGKPVDRVVTLFNPGTTSVRYMLFHDGGDCISLGHTYGVLAPGSERNLRVIVSSPGPETAGDFTSTIYYQFDTAEDFHAPPAPLCTIDATFVRPHIAVTDARATGLSKGRLWKMLGLTELNAALADTAAGSLNSDGEADEPLFDLHFDTAVLGEEDSVVDLEFTNTGVSKASWSMVFPDQLVYAPERWAAKTTLTSREAQEKEILASKIFQVSPRKGDLEPGETVVVKMKYKHLHVDADRLTVFLRVEGRPEVWLDLHGKTLPTGDGYLQLQSSHTQLEPVPIGLPLPSEQYYNLHNDGDEALSFKLDRSALAALQEDNYGFPVIQCDVVRGVIPARGSFTLPIKFWPVEPKEHTATLQIECDGNVLVPLTIHGHGYDERSNVLPRFVDGRNTIPTQQAVVKSGQQGFLSHERLYFGDVPMYSVNRRVVFLRNDSPEGHAMSYSFRCLPQYTNVVQIEPASGQLAGGDSVAVRVTLSACDGPSVYDFDLMCDVVNEQSLSNHEQAVVDSDRARVDAVTHFTLTDAGRTGRGRAGGHSTVTTEQGLRSVRGANVSLSDFPGALLATGHQPSYTSNLSTALAPGAPDPGQVQATISTNRAQTLRQQVLTQTGRIAGGPFEQNQTMSGDMKVFEESFSQDQSATWGPLTSGRTWVGVERPSSATRLQKLSGERTIPVSDTDLRTTKYQALPPIRVEHTKRAATPPPFEPPTVLFIGITAHIYAGLAPEDNLQIFDDEDELSGSLGMRKDFVDRRMFEPSSPDADSAPVSWSESNGEADTVVDILSAIMQQVVEDDNFAESIQNVAQGEEPVYYRQFAKCLPEDDGSAVEQPSAGSSATGEVDLRADPVFLSLAEECFESIFASMIAGADSGEIDLTARSRLILN